jgi:hypothetical protein
MTFFRKQFQKIGVNGLFPADVDDGMKKYDNHWKDAWSQ